MAVSHSEGRRQYAQRSGSASAVALVVIVSCAIAPSYAEAQLPGPFDELVLDQLALRIELVTPDGSISAREPLLARISIQNAGDTATSVPMGGLLHPLLRLSVRDADGNEIGGTPGRRGPLRSAMVWKLRPGETRTFIWVVTGCCCLSEPGEYTVRIELVACTEGYPVIVTGESTVTVLPYDRGRVEATCEALFLPLRDPASRDTNSPSWAVCVRALYSVRDDAVVPYLEWMIAQWGSTSACRALRRVGTPHARAVLDALSRRTDRAGEVVRATAGASTAPTIGDVVGFEGAETASPE